MGQYLDMAITRWEPSHGHHRESDYAREVMQLFTIAPPC